MSVALETSVAMERGTADNSDPGVAALMSVALAGSAAHLSEIRSTAELELENQRTVGHFVHIFTLVTSGNRGGGGITLALTLLHGAWP